MQSDRYGLFTECHRLYISGVRLAVRERLEAVHGNEWWNNGVLSIVSKEQREQLEWMATRHKLDALESLLDAPHFGAIICRTASFSDNFDDLSSTFRKFQRLVGIRNAWAHVQMSGISLAGVMQALEIMKDILASLRRREALDIERIRQEFWSQSVSIIPSEELNESLEEEDVDRVEDFDSGYAFHEAITDPLVVWSNLQSYLALNTVVESQDGSDDTARVTLRVSNNAPEGKNMPNVQFHDVSVRILPEGRYGSRRRNLHTSNLKPGETIEDELIVPVKLLASIEFTLEGRLDESSLFNFQRRAGLTGEIVKPILDDFVVRFESLRIKAFLDDVLKAIHNAGSTMTLLEAAQLRKDLEEFQSIVSDKINGICQLFHEFMFHNESTLGSQCSEVIRFLRELIQKMKSLDEAIGQTDAESMEQAINDLEQSQLAIIRLENTIKELAKPRQ